MKKKGKKGLCRPPMSDNVKKKTISYRLCPEKKKRPELCRCRAWGKKKEGRESNIVRDEAYPGKEGVRSPIIEEGILGTKKEEKGGRQKPCHQSKKNARKLKKKKEGECLLLDKEGGRKKRKWTERDHWRRFSHQGRGKKERRK